MAVAPIHCGEDPLPVIRFVPGVILVEILLVDDEIVEAVVLRYGDLFHISGNFCQGDGVDDDIVLDEDDILFVVHPEVPVKGVLGLGFVQGLLYLAAFILLQVNVKRNGVVLSASFMKLGLLVPMGVSILFFGEQPGIFHIVGFIVALIAIVMINYEPGHTANASFKAGLIILLVVGGLGDVMAKIYQEVGSADLSAQFLFYTFFGALVLCLGLLVWKKERPGFMDLFFGALIAVPNYFASQFLLKALARLDAVIVYPSYNVATIFLATLAGICLFRERLKVRQWIAIGAIVIALALLNL